MREDELSTIYARIGKTLKSRRKELGLTMEEVARKMGYSHKNRRTYVSQLETGKHDYKLSSLLLLSEVLDLSITDMVGQQPEKAKDSNSILLQNYRDLPPAGKKEVRDFLDYITHKYSN